jgi:hypothetical protein
MTTTGTVHVGDIGTCYQATIQDAGAPFDVSAAISALLIFQTPAGVLQRNATVSQEGADWVLTYQLSAGVDDAFHATPGVYRWQGIVAFADGQTFHTTIESYRVERNLDDTGGAAWRL